MLSEHNTNPMGQWVRIVEHYLISYLQVRSGHNTGDRAEGQAGRISWQSSREDTHDPSGHYIGLKGLLH